MDHLDKKSSFSTSFCDAAGDGKRAPFPYAFKRLKNEIKKLTRDDDNLNNHEPAMRSLFRNFLCSIGATPAIADFEALLLEKSGDKFYRDNGDVSWYHEFFPLMSIMELARKGKKNGGFDLDDLDKRYGVKNGDSLIILIISHLRHDSVEDVMSLDIDRFADEQKLLMEALRGVDSDFGEDRTDPIVRQSVTNVDLLSQKRVTGVNGKSAKESNLIYNQRLTDPVLSNPGAYMQKQGDVADNFATMHTAPKFPAQKKQDRCDGCEDRYGRRLGFTNRAIRQWSDFKAAIATMDDVIGIQLYISFRYLENVDLHYKEPSDNPVDIDGYLRRAMSLELPQAIHPVHRFLKDVMKSVDPEKNPEKYARLERFLTEVVMPPLEPYKDHFPYLLKSRTGESLKADPGPIASI